MIGKIKVSVRILQVSVTGRVPTTENPPPIKSAPAARTIRLASLNWSGGRVVVRLEKIV